MGIILGVIGIVLSDTGAQSQDDVHVIGNHFVLDEGNREQLGSTLLAVAVLGIQGGETVGIHIVGASLLRLIDQLQIISQGDTLLHGNIGMEVPVEVLAGLAVAVVVIQRELALTGSIQEVIGGLDDLTVSIESVRGHGGGINVTVHSHLDGFSIGDKLKVAFSFIITDSVSYLGAVGNSIQDSFLDGVEESLVGSSGVVDSLIHTGIAGQHIHEAVANVLLSPGNKCA